MSGPIVRSGPTQQYSSNWEQAFAGGTEKKKSAEKKPAVSNKKSKAKKKKT